MGEESGRTKRKAKTEDGSDKKPRLDASLPTFEVQPEVENFQREALWRSLQDYKRRATQSQEQLEKIRRQAVYHDDHLRIIDVWWDQLLDEIMIIIRETLPDDSLTNGTTNGDHFYDAIPDFVEHLNVKRQSVMKTILHAFRLAQTKRSTSSDDEPSVELQRQVAELSAQLRISEMKARKVKLEKDELEPKVSDLQERLASSQRKVDRQKSITLARIDQQARKGLHQPTPVGNKVKVEDEGREKNSNETTDGDLTISGVTSNAEVVTLQARNLQLAEECAHLQIRVAELTETIEALTRRLKHLTEEEIKGSTPFRSLQKANEHLRGHCEFLESRYQETMKEASSLRAERSATQEALGIENGKQFADLTVQLTKAEQDLARVRNARDELHSALQLRKAQDDARSASAREISELADTQATRITALEAEVTRLKEDYPEAELEQTNGNHEVHLSSSEMLMRIEQLTKENSSLKNELPTMEHAFNQAQEQNVRKVMDLASAEDRVSRLQAEKSKADQKYFAAMKAKDQLSFELKALKSQIMKSSDTITRIHEAEESTRAMLLASERQNTLLDQSCEQHKLELAKAEARVEQLQMIKNDNTKELAQTLDSLKARAIEIAQMQNVKRTLQAELATLQDRYTQVRNVQTMDPPSHDSDQLQVYRSMAMCSVCNTRWKNTVLSSCGHIFCRECVDKRVETRQRRCPSCNKGFGSGDIASVHL